MDFKDLSWHRMALAQDDPLGALDLTANLLSECENSGCHPAYR